MAAGFEALMACGMLVQVEAVRQAPCGPTTVRVRSEVGTVVALWCGDPTEVGREHYVEWTVDDDVAWDTNTRPYLDDRWSEGCTNA
ncbi:hypothetical protein OG257_36915 [Streptomyces sp. NBC_00683]|uniref:hypothetical protein n=1 Tax=Streptomyces sp. NBC_00683 TaxID=2903670 RepID=UPI002E32A57B|nr:hypothetical protein [Streptomyces sp. NBC_00683]